MNNQNEQRINDDTSLFEEFRTAVDLMVGEKSRFMKVPTYTQKPFWILAYDNIPTEGSTTAFTFGISSVPNDLWKLGRPELVISVDSQDDDWLISLAAKSITLRGSCPFSLGNVLRLDRPISNSSDMSAYFLFWPTILEKDQSRLELSDRTLNFVQAYPVFDSEADAIAKIGAESFFMTEGLEFSDVSRQAQTK